MCVGLIHFSAHSHALYNPAYLSEHVGHAYSGGGHCAVGVINGMMQHPWLFHLGPSNHRCAPPYFSSVCGPP